MVGSRSPKSLMGVQISQPLPPYFKEYYICYSKIGKNVMRVVEKNNIYIFIMMEKFEANLLSLPIDMFMIQRFMKNIAVKVMEML